MLCSGGVLWRRTLAGCSWWGALVGCWRGAWDPLVGCSGGVRWRMLWRGAYSEASKEEYKFSIGEVAAKGFATKMRNCDPSRKSTRRALRALRSLRALQASGPRSRRRGVCKLHGSCGDPLQEALERSPNGRSPLFWRAGWSPRKKLLLK